MIGSVQSTLADCSEDIAAKRYDRAETSLQRLLKAQPDNVQALYLWSCLMASTGRLDQGIAAISRAVAIQRDVTVYHLHLAELHRLKRDYFAAIESAMRAVAIAGNDAQPLQVLGALRLQLGETSEALQCFRAAVRLEPQRIDAILGVGTALVKLGASDAAEIEFNKALTLDPSASSYLAHASALAGIQPPSIAIAALRRAIESAPGIASYWTTLGTLQLQLGQLDDAETSFRAANAIDPKSLNAITSLAQVANDQNRTEILSTLEAALKDELTYDLTDRSRLHYALFQVYDSGRRFDEAFHHLAKANSIRRRMMAYDEPTRLQEFDDIIACVNRDTVERHAGGGFVSSLPIFILGMPRSGSTLVEQILGSHTTVFAGGELALLRNIAEGAYRAYGATRPHPFWLQDATAEQIALCGKLYVDRLRTLDAGALRITDKMPSNVNLLGLIHLALPHAKVILTTRDPRDICLSCFSKAFGEGHGYANDLGELGRYYRGYAKLVAHWRSVLPSSAFLEIEYEQLVADPEAQARRLLDFCQLPWERNVLDFQNLDRPVRTASVVQVRRPIYVSSVGRWQNYVQHLDALDRELSLIGR